MRRKERAAPPTAIVEALGDRDLLGSLDAVCAARGVTREELCGRRRTKNIALARQELWWRLRRDPGMSFSEIGSLFDRNHTTVMTGVRAFERAMAERAGANGAA